MRGASRQDGFTLIEVLVGMVLTVVVFGATLTALDAFNHQWQSAESHLSAQDSARLGIDRIVGQLRNIASPVTSPKLLERATPYDVVFQTVGSPSGGSTGNATGTQRVRYCIPPDPSPGAASTEVLWGETQTWSTSTPAADPWSSDPNVTIACPDSPLPSGVTATRVANSITNRYLNNSSPTRSAFCFNNSCSPPPDLSQVFTVQVDLFVNQSPGSPNAESQLTSAAFLRNQPRAPVASFTPTPIEGGGGVLLNGGPSYSPDGEDLSYAWSCTSPSPCPDSGDLSGAGTGLIVWRPGAGTYTIALTITDETGLQATSTQQVTVS